MKKLLLILVGTFSAFAGAPAASPPNVLLFLVDDMGVMDTSLASLTDAGGKAVQHPLNQMYRTPNMERLAQLGAHFERFYANSVCSPTRISLLTGQSSARHRTTQYIAPESNNAGAYGDKDWNWKGIAENTETLPALLQQAGYYTIHCGKGHFGPLGAFAEDPSHLGFSQNIAGCAYGQPGSYYGRDSFGNDSKGRRNRGVPGLEKYHGQDVHLTEVLTAEMDAAITGAVERKQPFFAYMAHYAVHAPFQVHQRYAAHYPDKKGSPLSFATMIEGMDASLGALLDRLDALGVAENTLVIFLGDNGSDAPLGPEHTVACAAPLRGKKGTHFEGGMRVPCIVAWAKPQADQPNQKRLPIQPQLLSREIGTIHDVMPTLTRLCGVKALGAQDGSDLAPLLAGGKRSDGPGTFLMHFPHEHRSDYFTVYIQGDWKLIYHYRLPEDKRYQLFDLKSDPYEADNVAGTQPAKLKAMTGLMIAALKDAGVGYPLAGDKKTLLFPVLPQ